MLADLMERDKPEIVPYERVVDALAQILHDKMEHLDPTDDTRWDCLTNSQREFYRYCIRELGRHPAALEVLARPPEVPPR